MSRTVTKTFTALLACAMAPAAVQAQGGEPAPAAWTGAANINITPRRVIFDGNKRAEAVYVFNQGNAAVTVDVALVDNVMLESGEIVPLTRLADKGDAAQAAAAALKSAKPMLLAAPSRLTLPPGQGRTIRVRAGVGDAAPGAEYRSHLTVTTVPPADTGLTAEQAAAADRGELVLRIQSIFGLSIPLIVRGPGTSGQTRFGPIRPGTDAGKPVLEVPVQRSGTGSVYGNIEARSGKSEIVGMVRGLAVYPEISERLAKVPLLRPLRKGETVTVTFQAEDTRPEGGALASGSFTAP